MDSAMGSPTIAPEEVRAAFARWSRTVQGAPRRLDAQVTRVELGSEEVVRLATTVVRRELVTERRPAMVSERPRGMATEARSIDPFTVNLDDLRARTEHGADCGGCRGGGRVNCVGCHGSGRARCPTCAGTGQILRVYQKSSRYIQCTECRTRGTVRCAPCGASGQVACGSCRGSGRELRWWAYRESTRTIVRFAAQGPAVAAHAALREERLLRPADLAPFSVRGLVEAHGPLGRERLSPEDDAAWRPLSSPVEPQVERVTREQLVRFTALRCDVTYEMCGASGTVALSGTTLAGAGGDGAERPIAARLRWWWASTVAAALAGAAYYSAWVGPTAYFDETNDLLATVVTAAVLATVVGAGGALRSLRPGLRRWPLRAIDRVALSVAVVAVLLCPAIWYADRPEESDARASLARSDVARARLVAEALEATAPSRGVATLIEDIDLYEARTLTGDARLARLDDAASRDGAHAVEARELARRHRLDEVRRSLAARQPDAALTLLDRWTAPLANDADATELRAQAADQKGARCADDPCRFGEAHAAVNARATPARRAALEALRRRVIDSLAVRPAATGDAAADVRSLRAVTTLAASLGAVRDEPAVTAAARSAEAWAAEQRSRVVLLGAPAAVVEDVLGRTGGGSAAPAWPELAGVAVYTAGTAERCAGLYVVGATRDARALTGHEAGLRRLLIQATGVPDAALHSPAAGGRSPTVASWREGSTPVTTRWCDGALMELRIGEAEP